MFKWLSVVVGVLAAIGGVVLGTGSAHESAFTCACVVAVLVSVSAVSAVAHFVLNNRLNPIPAESLQSRTHSLSSQLNEITQQSDSKAAEAIFLSAQYHQLGHNGQAKNLNKAFDCYITAAKLGREDALIPLERLAEDMSAENQMKLSKLYTAFFKNQERAVYWGTKAKEVDQFNFNM